jgi:hypothetical protein
MVQQNSYAQEVDELVKHQEVSNNSSLKILHPFIDQEGSQSEGTITTIWTSLPNHESDDFTT